MIILRNLQWNKESGSYGGGEVGVKGAHDVISTPTRGLLRRQRYLYDDVL